ncbi:acyltransferase [Microbacterium sp. NPDC019599]|uniref:acyltransferase family protein n=1 Tax=Microbacterium sp. NPDC019599 TaxID=3154690 RepID=UPI00340BFD07
MTHIVKPAVQERIRLPYLDGIRGLAALSIAVFHAYKLTGKTGESDQIPIVGSALQFGFLGVPVFIVLSGYVLMLPVARNNNRLTKGFGDYIGKRAWRILPPYYAALALSLLLILLVPILQQPSGTQWDSKVPVTVPDVVLHALMLQDFSAESIGKVNGPLWSVAVEWHIYFLMPLLLLPLWRLIGGTATTLLMLLITFVLVLLDVGTFAHPWLVALFAAGMLAAQVTVRDNVRPRTLCLIAVATGVAIVGLGARFHQGVVAYYAVEVLVGLMLAVGLAAIGPRSVQGRTPKWIGRLGSKPLVTLGLFSYSIYLVHSPLLGLANLLLLPLGLPVTVQYLVMTFVVLPIVLVICYGFFWLVERHFLNSRQKQVVDHD